MMTFPPASLASQLAELKRERKMRGQVYPHLISSRKLTKEKADYHNNGLDGAIATLERLVIAQASGEPGRRELIEALRRARNLMGPDEIIDALLAKVPE